MRIEVADDLPFTSVTLRFRGREVVLDRVLIDTGSATSVFAVDLVASLGIRPEPDDRVRTIRGVGAVEPVFTKIVDHLAIVKTALSDLELEFGRMDYGIRLDGILGMDILLPSGAIVDPWRLALTFRPEQP